MATAVERMKSKKLDDVGGVGIRTRLLDITATLDDVVAHIDHAVKVGGIDCVGIGTDFDGVSCTPVGLDDVSKFPNLIRALKQRGYSDVEVRKIAGGNLLRVMRAVEGLRN